MQFSMHFQLLFLFVINNFEMCHTQYLLNIIMYVCNDCTASNWQFFSLIINFVYLCMGAMIHFSSTLKWSCSTPLPLDTLMLCIRLTWSGQSRLMTSSLTLTILMPIGQVCTYIYVWFRTSICKLKLDFNL